jgi:hypothetical protein
MKRSETKMKIDRLRKPPWLEAKLAAKIALIVFATQTFAQEAARTPLQEAAIVYEQYLARLKAWDFEGAQKFWNVEEASQCKPADWLLAAPNNLQQEVQTRGFGFDHQVVESAFAEGAITLKLKYTLKEQYRQSQEIPAFFEERYFIKENDKWVLANPVKVLARDWKTHESKNFRFHFPPDLAPASLFYAFVDSSYQAVADLFDYQIHGKPAVYLCHSGFELQKLSAYQRPVPGRSLPECNLLFSAFNETPTAQKIPEINVYGCAHEALHVLAYKIFGEDRRAVPFLREGFSVALAGVWGFPPEVSFDWAKQAMAQNKNPGLQALNDPQFFYSKEVRHYALAGSFIKFLLEQYGVEQFKLFYAKLNEPAQLHKALLEAYGKALEQAENEWKEFVRQTQVSFGPQWASFTFEEVDR